MVHPLGKKSETEVIEWLFRSPSSAFTAFEFMFRSAIGWHNTGWRLCFWINLDRWELGLDRGGKPGDIDVLIVPELDGDRFAEKAMAIEVKRAYVPEKRLEKSPSSFGTSQAKGLLRDGFPFAGLLHNIFVEEASAKYRQVVPLMDSKGGKDGLDQLGEVEMSFSAMLVAERHEGRILKTELPENCGYNLQVFQLNEPNEGFLGQNCNENRSAQKNVSVSKSLVEQIRNLDMEPDFKIDFNYNSMEIKEARERQLMRAFTDKVDKSWRQRGAS